MSARRAGPGPARLPLRPLLPPDRPAAPPHAPRRTGADGLRAGARLAAAAGLLAALAGCALLPEGRGPAAGPAAAPPAAPAVPALRLEVVAPGALKALLQQHLDLARLQQLGGDDAPGPAELNRLIGAAPAQVRALLQTEGHFEPQVQVDREPGPEARGTAPPAPGLATATTTVRLRVDPGPPTRVAALQVEPQGELARRAAAGDAEAGALQQSLPATAAPQPGEVFRNADWSAGKQAVLTRLRAAGYAAASLAESRAEVDVPARQATLRLRPDSGPLFLAGALVVDGLNHHDEATVRAQAGFDRGAPLTEQRLLDYQDRLQRTQLFQSVSVGFEPDPAQAAQTPVRVRLGELPLQQATVGVGISANAGPRATLEHVHRRPLGWAVVARNKLEWGQKSQLWSGDFQTHPGPRFQRTQLGGQIDREVSDTDVVLSQRLRLGRAQETRTLEQTAFVELLRSRQADLPDSPVAQRDGAGVRNAGALSANLHLVWRRLDSVLLPTRGVTLALQGGVGQARGDGSSGPFSRLYGRLVGYLPLGQQWYGQARLEAGQVFKRDGLTVPDALGFRAGGDDSVRGYAYRSLAPTTADGGTISGEHLLTASVELARPISARLPSVWGAVFVDAGRAVARWQDYSPAWGYGVGVRWRSPIGPLRMDLAWADELQKLRLHLSVGIAF